MATSDSFAEFVTQRSQRLLRTAYLLTRDWAHAEDLLQTALVRAWRAWGRIEADPEPYVRRVLVNSYFSWWRRRWRQAEQPVEQLPDHPAVDETALADERQRVWLAMGRLPRRQRAVLVLRYFEDMTEAQIAGVLGISVGTVKTMVWRYGYDVSFTILPSTPGIYTVAVDGVAAGTVETYDYRGGGKGWSCGIGKNGDHCFPGLPKIADGKTVTVAFTAEHATGAWLGEISSAPAHANGHG